jgi:hypothetical protein
VFVQLPLGDWGSLVADHMVYLYILVCVAWRLSPCPLDPCRHAAVFFPRRAGTACVCHLCVSTALGMGGTPTHSSHGCNARPNLGRFQPNDTAVVFPDRLEQHAFVTYVLRPHGTWVALSPIHPMVAMHVPSWDVFSLGMLSWFSQAGWDIMCLSLMCFDRMGHGWRSHSFTPWLQCMLQWFS